MRADADRNRQKLIESGRELLADGSPLPSMRALAEHAGLGVGTLYRHFASREQLITAVYADEIAGLAETKSLLANGDAAHALSAWFQRFLGFTRTKHTTHDLLHTPGADRPPSARLEVTAALQAILDAGRRDGSLRTDLDADDLLRAATGIWRADDHGDPEWERRSQRLIRLIIDGATPRATQR